MCQMRPSQSRNNVKSRTHLDNITARPLPHLMGKPVTVNSDEYLSREDALSTKNRRLLSKGHGSKLRQRTHVGARCQEQLQRRRTGGQSIAIRRVKRWLHEKKELT